MKRCISVLLCMFLAVTLCGCSSASYDPDVTYFRIHIRANSNSETDQSVKYDVRDEVVAFLTPKLRDAVEFETAVAVVSGELRSIENVAKRVLTREGFGYGARAAVREEDFPTRKYGDLVLPAGRYRALVVELGDGTGDNWWCVAYPPLCFGGAGKIVVRSKIAEIVRTWFNPEEDCQQKVS